MIDQNYGENTFSAVWKRVTEASNYTLEPLKDERGTLIALIDRETENLTFYKAEEAYTLGSCSSLFKTLAAASAARLRRLRTFDFLLYGGEHASPTVIPICSGIINALRDAYRRESEIASQLISASAIIGSGKFKSCAGEFARMSSENAEHIMQFLEKIMQ